MIIVNRPGLPPPAPPRPLRIELKTRVRCLLVLDARTRRVAGLEVLTPQGRPVEWIERAQFDDWEQAIARLPHMPDVRDGIAIARDYETKQTTAALGRKE